MTRVALAATHHDPDRRLYALTARWLPALIERYTSLVLRVTAETDPASVTLLRDHGVQVITSQAITPSGFQQIGLARREAVAQAAVGDCTHIHMCDFDRVLHWIAYAPDELTRVLHELDAYDFTVLGRTPRAFATHPRIQRDTEQIINHVFHTVSGLDWDVTAASRGLSRHTAHLLVNTSADDTIGNDCSWPLLLLQRNDVTLGYRATEGLEFETADRYEDEIAACGSREAWLARLDADPRAWATRLELARIEVEAIAKVAR